LDVDCVIYMYLTCSCSLVPRLSFLKMRTWEWGRCTYVGQVFDKCTLFYDCLDLWIEPSTNP